MCQNQSHTARWAWSIFFIIFAGLFVKSCHKDSGPVTPQEPAVRTVTLNLNVENNPQAKATGLVVELAGLNENDEPVGPVVDPIVIETPTYPLAIEVSLYVPPCRYLVTVTTALSREAARVEEGILNMCSDANVDVSVDTFEEFEVEGARFDAPDSAEAGETIDVRCGIDTYEAPDSERASLTMTLSEYKGKTFSETLSPAKLSISGSFPDPYPLTSSETRREFSCVIDDGRSTPQRVERTVTRKVTLCEVINERNSGSGSLRQVLEDADRNRCSGITFASEVSTITVSSPLIIASGTLTIDGGTSNVAVSGNDETRVFGIGSAAAVTFQNLLIINGNADRGGGISNGGTLTLGSGTIVGGNTAAISGGGIVNGGTLTIENGAEVRGNQSQDDGGGIDNHEGTLIVYGTVEDNWAVDVGGGIVNDNGTVSIKTGGILKGNTANYGSGIFNNLNLTVDGDVDSNNGSQGIANNDGTLTVNGSVKNNPQGGIMNVNGTVTINGTVSGNCGSSGNSGIYNDGGTLTIGGSAKILNNQPSAFGVEGAGIANMNGGSLLVKSGALISGNGSGTTQQGGGIANGGTWSSGGTVEIESGAVISNNSAYDGGGIDNHDGTLTVDGIVENNSATFGGGIQTWDATTTILSNCVVRNNTAGAGAGVFNGDFGVSGTTIIHGTIRDNHSTMAPFGTGGGVANTDGSVLTITSSGRIINNIADAEGGGISNDNGTVTINGIVTGNTAANEGGGIWSSSGTVNNATAGNVYSNAASVCDNYYDSGICILP